VRIRVIWARTGKPLYLYGGDGCRSERAFMELYRARLKRVPAEVIPADNWD
jgi:hypothetical protein